MSAKLEIGASPQRHRRRRNTSEPQREPGESAWDLHANEPPNSRFGADTQARLTGPSNSVRSSDDRQQGPLSHGEPPQSPMLPGFFSNEEASPCTPGFDGMRFVRGLWRHKWHLIIIALGSTALLLMIALTMPREWQATSTLISDSREANLQADAAQPLPAQSHDLQTFVDTIELPSSLDEAMRRAGISVMRETLAAAIQVRREGASKLFSITVTWHDPDTAARIANVIAELLVENSTRIRVANIKEVFNNYSVQLSQAQAELQRINDALLAYSEARNISSLESQISALVGLITETEASYNANTARVEALRTAKRRLDKQLEAEPELVVTSSSSRSSLEQRLADYRQELMEARKQYSAHNPKVIRLRHRIDSLEQIIAENDDETAPGKVYQINHKRGELSLRKQQTEDQLKLAEAEAQAQRETLDQSRSTLSQLVAARTGWESLNAQSKDAARLVDSLRERQSEARIAMQQIDSGFRLLERARPPQHPEPSLRKLMVAGAVVVGISIGLLVALLLELLDPIIRTARDAQTITRCPLILELEEIPASTDARIDPDAPTAAVAVVFRRMVRQLRAGLGAKGWQPLAITSAEPKAGRSLVATNLAAAIGLQDEAVLVVDADLRVGAGRRPAELLEAQPASVATGTGEQPDESPPELSDVLSGRCAWQQAVLGTARPGVSLLASRARTAREPKDDDDQLSKLADPGFTALSRELKKATLPVLYDLPPMTESDAVAEAAARIEQCLLVVRCNHTQRSALKRLCEQLATRGIEIRAVVVTMVPQALLTIPSCFQAGYRGHWLDRRLVSKLVQC